MCVRGITHTVNASSKLIHIHLSGHEGWGYYTVTPHTKREGPVFKFTEEPWFPGREFSAPCNITEPSGKTVLWKGSLHFTNFSIVAESGLFISEDPSGKIQVQPAKFGDDTQAFIAKWFFDHDGSRRHSLPQGRQFDPATSANLEGAPVSG